MKVLARMHWDETCHKAGYSKKIFDVLNSVKKNHEIGSPKAKNVIKFAGKEILNSSEQANTFLDYYAITDSPQPIPFDMSGEENDALYADLSLIEMQDAIRLTRNSAPGQDGIYARMIKEISKENLKVLLQLFNKIWISGEVPTEWKHAVVLPIAKNGKNKSFVTSYRPISLTSTCSKIFERILLRRLINFAARRKLFFWRQYGFVPFRDCQAALLTLQQDIMIARKKKKFIFCIALDIKSAYDSIWLDALMLKLVEAGIGGRMAKWIFNFIFDRSLSVKWRGTTSNIKSNNRGVPQGCVLSPFLFMLFLRDIFEAIPFKMKSIIYADDIFLYVSENNFLEAKTLLQEALNRISQWCNYWKLRIDPAKCSIIDFSTKKQESSFNLNVNGQFITWTQHMRILGVYFSDNMKFGFHFQYLKNKIVKKTNVIKAIAANKWGAKSHHLIKIVNSVIRSTIDYGCVVYATASRSERAKLESVYHEALRIATGLPRWTPIPILRLEAGQTSLYARHNLMSTIFFIRVASLGEISPCAELRREVDQSDVDWRSRERAPIFIKMEKWFENRNITEANLIKWRLPNPKFWDLKISIHIEEFPFQNKNYPASAIVGMFDEFRKVHLGNKKVIATDASKTDVRVMIAALDIKSKMQSVKYVDKVNSIFTAEALAIWDGVKQFITENGPYVILTDSKSVLMALQSSSNKSPKVILMLQKKLLESKADQIKLVWTPAHKGISENEAADQLAKSSGNHEFLDWISPEDLESQIKKEFREKSILEWRNCKYAQIFPYLENVTKIKKMSNNRHAEVLLRRLRTRTLTTNAMLYRVKLSENPNCTTCGVEETTDHFLLSCRRFSGPRRTLSGALGIDVGKSDFMSVLSLAFSSKQQLDAVSRFLVSCGRF